VQLKDYQQKVLDTLDAYLDELIRHRERAAKIVARNAEIDDPDFRIPVPEFPREAWEALRSRGHLPAARHAVSYSSRTSGDCEAVPNATLKVPTGGGKTLLATVGVTHILNKYRRSNTGMVLWIVPNEAIFTQTQRQSVRVVYCDYI